MVSLGQLEELALQLDKPETAASLDMKTLSDFFKLNLEMRVSGIPSGTKPNDSSGTYLSDSASARMGFATATVPSNERRFASYQPIDSTYEAEVQEYFAKLDPQPKSSEIAQAHRDAIPDDDPTESMATFIFRDYFLLIAKAAVQAAISAMEGFPYTVTGANNESLSSIAALFPTVTVPYIKREGDTVDQVADAFGMSSSEILALNPNLKTELDHAAPGQTINVNIGATPESIAAGNPSWPLNPNVAIALGDIPHQVLDGESLRSIAIKFGSNVDTWLQDPKLLAQLNLLQSGAPLNYPQSSFVNSRSITLGLVAAFFYIRINGTATSASRKTREACHSSTGTRRRSARSTTSTSPDRCRSQCACRERSTISVIRSRGSRSRATRVWTIAAMFALYQNQTGNTAFENWLTSGDRCQSRF